MKTLSTTEQPAPLANIFAWAKRTDMDYEMIEETDDQHFNNLQDSLDSSPWLNEVEEECELAEALTHVVVSEAVRKECERTMLEAERRGWRL